MFAFISHSNGKWFFVVLFAFCFCHSHRLDSNVDGVDAKKFMRMACIRYAIVNFDWKNDKTSKSAQHLLHLMRLMTIIDRSNKRRLPIQCIKCFLTEFVHQHVFFSFMMFILMKRPFHNQSSLVDCLLFQLFLLPLINW